MPERCSCVQSRTTTFIYNPDIQVLCSFPGELNNWLQLEQGQQGSAARSASVSGGSLSMKPTAQQGQQTIHPAKHSPEIQYNKYKYNYRLLNLNKYLNQ